MLSKKPIPFLDLVLSISEATDLIDVELNNHNKRVAFTSLNIADNLGLPNNFKYNLIIAGLLHDIGSFSLKERHEILNYDYKPEHPTNNHSYIGYVLLKDFYPLSEIASIIKFHHHLWKDIEDTELPEALKLSAQIIHIADRIDVMIDKNRDILSQVGDICHMIKKGSRIRYRPDIIKEIINLKNKEYFWLDAVSQPEISTFTDKLGYLPLDFEMDLIDKFANMFSHIIDFRSPFTATHSSGVTATAEFLSRAMNFSDNEVSMMKIAGYLHDLGKLAVPSEILDKAASLNNEEFRIIRSHTYYTYRILENITNLEIINSWAAFHHETLDGNGYPFHLKEGELSLGSKIMAVADIFAAITEDRPYRKGMNKKESLKVLNNMVKDNKIDSNIVAKVRENFNEISDAREKSETRAKKYYKEYRSIFESQPT
jgi:HD-GYP domain-containing protein (c-di-GMP phosphodiesterase class II)